LGSVVFEAAYSRKLDGGLIERGAIDCLIVTDDRVTVLEFKSGQPSEWHQDQLAAYADAARLCYPGRAVEGRVIYLSAP